MPRTFTNDPGLSHVFRDPAFARSPPPATSHRRRREPSIGTSDEEVQRNDEHEIESDSGDSLVGAKKKCKQPMKRARRTKAQIEMERIEDLIRPVTEFPPELKLNPRELLKIGASGVAELEKGKVSMKIKDIQGAKGLEGLQRMTKVTEKQDRRMNRTDLSGYQKEAPQIGLDVDEEVDYDEDPYLWRNRDSVLKVPVDYEGNQRRAHPTALGHATSASLATPSAAGITPASFLSFDRADATDNDPAREATGFDQLDDDDGVDELFEDADDLEQAVAPGDVFELDYFNISGKHSSHVPRTSRPLDWSHANDWAKSLKKVGFDFLVSDGSRVDCGKVLQSSQLPEPDDLKRLNEADSLAVVEEDDFLFVAMQESHESRQKEMKQRHKERSEIKKRLEKSQALFSDLRFCVATLLAQEETNSEDAYGRQLVRARGPSVDTWNLNGIAPQSSARVDAPQSPIVEDRVDYGTLGVNGLSPHPSTTASRSIDIDRIRHEPSNEADYISVSSFRKERAQHGPRCDQPRPISALLRGHGRGYHDQDYRKTRGWHSRTGHKGLDRGRTHTPFSRYKPDTQRDANHGDAKRAGTSGFGGNRGGGYLAKGPGARQRYQRPAEGFNWGGSGKDDDTAAGSSLSVNGWNPDPDDLDPILKQFGKR